MATKYKTSGLDFSSVHNEIDYWLAHTSSYFKGGFSGSGENGNDFAMPTGTPVYAVQSGTVVGQGYYGGGGVVSVKSSPKRIWYYQHLDQNVAQVGETVQAGQLIGYSGGQNSGGNHPSSPEFSGYQHIEVGINAPWGGIWGNDQGLPNIDPRPTLLALAVGSAFTNTLGAGGLTTTAGSAGSAGNCAHSVSLFPGNTTCLDAPLDLAIRGGLLFAAAILIILGIIIFGMGNPSVQQTVSRPVEGAATAGKTLAKVAGIFAL